MVDEYQPVIAPAHFGDEEAGAISAAVIDNVDPIHIGRHILDHRGDERLFIVGRNRHPDLLTLEHELPPAL